MAGYLGPLTPLAFLSKLRLEIKYIHTHHLFFPYLSVLLRLPRFAVIGWAHSAELLNLQSLYKFPDHGDPSESGGPVRMV